MGNIWIMKRNTISEKCQGVANRELIQVRPYKLSSLEAMETQKITSISGQ